LKAALPNREIRVGDCRALLRELPDESVNCVVTSPPYWGLRDYGIPPTVWGGDPGHAHDWTAGAVAAAARAPNLGPKVRSDVAFGSCECGAWRGVLGLEPTPEMFVAHVVEVFEEVRRVLRHDGTCWVNIGDSYCGAAGGGTGKNGWLADRTVSRVRARMVMDKRVAGLKEKDLVGVPWMVAFALRAAGWWLRAENIWHKANPIPESVTDRPCRDHEQVFLFTKSARYAYDAEAVKEKASGTAHSRVSVYHKGVDKFAPGVTPKSAEPGSGVRANKSFHAAIGQLVEMRNMRTVWKIVGHQYDGAHFATFPPELAQRCILAGCPAGGLVLDPFGGSGTVGEVAEALGRRWMLLELNPAYAELARARTAQRGLFGDVAAAALASGGGA
jgi:DNA modification methylase